MLRLFDRGEEQGLHITWVSAHGGVGFNSPNFSYLVAGAKTCSEVSLKPAAIWEHQGKAETAHAPQGDSYPTPKTWPHGQGKRLRHRFVY